MYDSSAHGRNDYDSSAHGRNDYDSSAHQVLAALPQRVLEPVRGLQPGELAVPQDLPEPLRARNGLGWPTKCKLTCEFRWECSYRRLKLDLSHFVAVQPLRIEVVPERRQEEHWVLG
jgi:hypothetical protein